MKTRNTVYSVIVVAIVMLFAGTSFAETSLADIKAKRKAAQASGVVTLADVQAKLKGAKAQKERIRIQGISKRFGTSDLHALKLTKGSEGDTIGEIAEVVSASGLRNIRKIVEGNGLTMKQCRNLKAGFVFYIPTKMIAEELRLNAFEIAQLKEDLRIERGISASLRDKVSNLRGTVTAKEKQINVLTGKLKAEVAAHNVTKGKLVTANNTIATQQKEITAIEATNQTLNGNVNVMGIVMLSLAGIAILVVVFLIIRALARRFGNKKAPKTVKRQVKADNNGKGEATTAKKVVPQKRSTATPESQHTGAGKGIPSDAVPAT